MLRRIAKYIDRYGLLQKQRRYLVALSGGADSVALLRILLGLGYQVEAAHCNFRLRGDESDRDERFCRDLCDRLGVAIHVAHFDTKTYAELHHVSIEMAARELRYNYFRQLINDLSLEAVCVAHHRDDSVETVLLNMMRGTGIDGLKGIVPRNGCVIRPLLGVSRCELIDYLSSLGQDYVKDSSNLVPDVQRNKVRLNVLPEMEKVAPGVMDNIANTASHVRDVIPLVEYAVSMLNKDVVLSSTDDSLEISIEHLLLTPSPKSMLWYLLRDKGFSSVQTEQIYDNLTTQTGRLWSSNTHELLINRGVVVVKGKQNDSLPELKVPECGKYVYKNDVVFRFSKSCFDDVKDSLKQSEKACLNLSNVSFPLVVRPVREGDWFVPFGMKGRKLLSDFLTDKKMSLFEKRQQLVVRDASGSILWVVNQRVDARFAVSADTKEVLLIESLHE